MPGFCTKCGAALTLGKQFCTACGAPATPSDAPQTSAPPPSGGNAVKIILIVVGALVAFAVISILAVVFGIYRVSRAVHVNQTGETVILHAPGGTITTGQSAAVSEAELGIPVYPDAKRGDGGMQIQSAEGSVQTVLYSTTDPPSKVVDFYKSNLPSSTSVIRSGNSAIITTGNHDKESWMITISAEASDGGKTKIVIMHARKR